MATMAAQAPIAEVPSWRAIVRAMGQAGGASIASGVLSLLAVKIIALLLGPAEVALLTSLQQLRQTAVTGATLTGQTALIQGASASTGRRRREFLRTSLVLIASATSLVCAGMVWFSDWAANQAGLPSEQHSLAISLVAAVVSSVVFVFLAAVVNASGAIGSLALLQLAAPAAMAMLAYPVARGFAHGDGGRFVAMLALSSAAAVVAAGLILYGNRASLQGWIAGPGRWWDGSAARHFFSISGSMFASGILSSWMMMIVRGQILRSQGLAIGGEFDAAWAISMNQAGLVLASLQSYYLPALARTRDLQQRSAHIGRVLTIAVLGGAALIAMLAVFKPWLISGFYSDQFVGAVRYLRWTLIGDYLKITSWILSIPLVASGSMRAFLTADLTANVSFMAAAFGFGTWFSAAESTAIAFVIMYVVHMLFCGACLYSRGEFRPGKHLAAIWAGGLSLVIAASAITWEQI
jgi:PST family polysaccharide transporter